MTYQPDSPANEARFRGRRFDILPGIILAAGLMMISGAVFAQLQLNCGSLNRTFGPFDYNDPKHLVAQGNESESKRRLVERLHFTPEVENLVRGFSAHTPLPDLEYTLRVFPNHHRALYAIANYHIKNKKQKMGQYSIDCWFDRAIRFRSDDAVVKLVYGIYLARTGKTNEALSQYKSALEIQPNSAESNYNIGLLYLDLKEYGLALKHAELAYGVGYPLPGLRNRLKEVGAWKQIAVEQ